MTDVYRDWNFKETTPDIPQWFPLTLKAKDHPNIDKLPEGAPPRVKLLYKEEGQRVILFATDYFHVSEFINGAMKSWVKYNDVGV